MRKPDNLVALHRQETGSYHCEHKGGIDGWAMDRILSQRDRIEELETMVKIFRGCIETGVFPKQGSRCHKIVHELVGESESD